MSDSCSNQHEGLLPCRGKYKHFTAPDPLGVGRVGHVRPRRLLHGLLVELVFGHGNRPQRADPQ